MKIAYCIHGLSNLGGMERIITAKANWLVRHGHSVTVITTEQKGKPNFFVLDPSVNTVDLDIGYTYIPAGSVLSITRAFMAKKRLHKKRLSEYLHSTHFDIVISTFGNEASILPDIKDSSKKIAEIHFEKNYRLNEDKGLAGRLIGRLRTWQSPLIARRYDMFVTLTRQDMAQWRNVRNITVIPNFVTATSKVSDLKAKRAISVGRLSYQKAFDILIDLWAKVAPMRPDWILDIYGTGELQESLQTRINVLGLQHCVTLRGSTSNITQEYLSSSVFLMTSRWEGLPMVLTEAMNFGLIPVTFDFRCGPRDLISDGESGFIVPMGDTEGMAQTIIDITGNLEAYRHIGSSAHQAIEKNFTTDAVMHRWIELFNQVML